MSPSTNRHVEPRSSTRVVPSGNRDVQRHPGGQATYEKSDDSPSTNGVQKSSGPKDENLAAPITTRPATSTVATAPRTLMGRGP